MARPHPQPEFSPFYPPRARWNGPLIRAWDSLRGNLGWEGLNLPAEITIGRLILAFVVPGLAVWFRRPGLLGKLALAASAFLALILLLWFGTGTATLAGGLLMSLHSTGIVFYSEPFLVGEGFYRRIFFSCTIFVILTFLVYAPARSFVQNQVVMPLLRNGELIIVRHSTSPEKVERGDRVAYRIEGNNSAYGQVRVGGGMSMGKVLALPGDRIAFNSTSFTVNFIPYPALPHMPQSGQFYVEGNSWFIWPEMDISTHGVPEETISKTMLGLAKVSQNQYFGKPLNRWFFHKQPSP